MAAALIPAPASPRVPDDTRARLIEAAGSVFAEQGFRAATVREICARAGANIAAVNYHFRDKVGLYVEVMRASIGSQGEHDPRRLGLDDKAPAEALRTLIASMLHRAMGDGRAAWPGRIMVQELAQPTEALPRVVEEVIGPNYAILRGVLSRMLNRPASDDLTRLCAHSIIGQVSHYLAARPVINILWPAMKLTPEQIGLVAGHIAEFSISGIAGVAATSTKSKTLQRKRKS